HCLVVFFFFFQAEDGIRDFHVTGVQTCALPIFLRPRRRFSGCGRRPRGPTSALRTRGLRERLRGALYDRGRGTMGERTTARGLRSEERRVGKERGGRQTGEAKRWRAKSAERVRV